jgi:GTPase SAR1 family protein
MSFFDHLTAIYKFITDRFGDKGKIPLPSIVTIGSESSGKSSLLENITQREIFPRNKTRCTMCPVRIVNSHKLGCYAKIEFEGKEYVAGDDISIKQTIDKIFQGCDNVIRDTPIVVTICNSDLPDGLSFTDLPGLCVDVKLTHDIARKYMEGDVLILCTVPSTIPRFTADQAISLIKNNNKLKDTILVLTVPDKIPEDDLDEFLVSRLNGSSHEFNKSDVLAVFSVINRALVKGLDKYTLGDSREKEIRFFDRIMKENKCKEISASLGTDKLITLLDLKFRKYIEEKWYPQVKKDITDEAKRLCAIRDNVGAELVVSDFEKIYVDLLKLIDVPTQLPSFCDESFTVDRADMNKKIKEFVTYLLRYMSTNINEAMVQKTNKLRLDRYPETVKYVLEYINVCIGIILSNDNMFENFATAYYASMMLGQNPNALIRILSNDIDKQFTLPQFKANAILKEFAKFKTGHEKKWNEELNILGKKGVELEKLMKSTSKTEDIQQPKSKTIKDYLTKLFE